MACTTLLKITASSVLDSVYFRAVKPTGINGNSEDVADFCSEISRFTSLTSVKLEVNSRPTRDVLNRATFEPLLQLHKLRELSIDTRHPLNVDDDLLRNMALAWQDITKIEFCADYVHQDRRAYSPASLSCLLPFASHCPNLLILGIPVNVDLKRMSQEWREKRPRGWMETSKLRRLRFGRAVVDDPLSAAVFLSDLFPALNEVWSTFTEDIERETSLDFDENIGIPDEIIDWWEDLAALVEIFASVRAQEREWVATHGRQARAPGARGGRPKALPTAWMGSV